MYNITMVGNYFTCIFGTIMNNSYTVSRYQKPPNRPKRENRELVKRKIQKTLKEFSESDLRVFYYLEVAINNNWHDFVNYNEVDLRHFLIQEMFNYISPEMQLEKLINIKTYHIVPDFYLRWVLEDVRASLFFGTYLGYNFSCMALYGRSEYLEFIKNIIKTSTIHNEQGVTRIYPMDIHCPDLLDVNIHNLDNLKWLYLNHKVKNKSLKWFDEKNEEQIEWAYDYLRETQEKLILTDIFFPKDIKDKYYLILASLDVLSNRNSEMYEVKNGKKTMYLGKRDFCIYQMRRAWNSILFTKKKNEEAEKLIIKVQKNNYEKLEKLSKYFKTSNNKLINKFITSEYEKIYATTIHDESIEEEIESNEIISKHF